MAARLAATAQSGGAGGAASPTTVRELIVIPEIPNSIHLQHAIQQVSSTVVEVNGDSSGHSSPSTEPQHTYITVAMPVQNAWNIDTEPLTVKVELSSDQESEGGNSVNYQVQYVDPQEIYTQGHQTMESLRSYPLYSVSSVSGGGADAGQEAWGGAGGAEYTYGVVVAGDEAGAPASPATPAAPVSTTPRMPPATVQWLLDHYETAEGVSLPRSTLYTHYLRHCTLHRLDPVNAASFGKLIRSVFVGLRTRRLGTRGNSKYHYYGIRAKNGTNTSTPSEDNQDDKTELPEQETVDREPASSPAGSVGSVSAHRQYLGAAVAPDPPDLTVDECCDLSTDALHNIWTKHRDHGVELLEAVSSLDVGGVERARRGLWRGVGAAWARGPARALARWVRAADLRLYQRAADMLLPNVLQPVPPNLTQSIRNFAKSVESALSVGGVGAPATAQRAQRGAAGALAAALRRYTSLNHLAQAARAVLANQHQIQQMVADLNRVDFRVVREQASWACSCGTTATANKLEADFKATLSRGATLEQWAEWLESCVTSALAPHSGRADYTSRARRLLLDWSFYSSLVIRELTLRSAASFGSFHLIRLLYDEYVSYLIERRVAEHLNCPPIAVMQRFSEEEEEDEEHLEEVEEEEQEWEWEDEEDEEDEPGDHKRARLHA